MSKRKIKEEGSEVEEVIPAVEVEPKVEVDELQTLKDQIEAEKKEKEAFQAKVDEEREAWRKERDDIAQKYTREATEKVKYQSDSIDSRIDSAKSESDRLEKEMEAAIEKGDFVTYAKLNTQFTKAQLRIDQYSEQKTQVKQPEQIKYKTASESWIDEHPLYKTDSRYEAIATGAHYEAVAEGIRVESPEYFRFVEKSLDSKYYKKTEKEPEEDERRMESIPPSRQGAGSPMPVDTIRLTSEQREFALNNMRFAPDGTRRTDAECLKEYRDEKIESDRKLAARGY